MSGGVPEWSKVQPIIYVQKANLRKSTSSWSIVITICLPSVPHFTCLTLFPTPHSLKAAFFAPLKSLMKNAIISKD